MERRMHHHVQRQRMSIVEIPAIYRTRHAGTSKSNFGKILFTYTAAAVKLKRAARRNG